jgi:hypothetical protein
MERVLESYEFGPHRVDVVEYPEDEGGGYVVVVADGIVLTEPPLTQQPSLEDVVRVYSRWQQTLTAAPSQ